MKAMRKIHKGQRPRAGRGLAQKLTAVAKALRNEGVPESQIREALMAQATGKNQGHPAPRPAHSDFLEELSAFLKDYSSENVSHQKRL